MKIFVNALTILRLLATFYVPILWNHLSSKILLVIVGLILITDFFDGFLARTFKVSTLFGCVLDVIADKAFGIIMLLIVARYVPLYYFMVTMEIIIALINLYGFMCGATTKSSFLGRFKMWFLGLSTLVGMLSILSIVEIKNDIVVIGFVFMTTGSEIMVAIDYLRGILKEIKKNNLHPKYKLKDKDTLMSVLFDTDYYLKNKHQPISKSILRDN